MHLVQFQLQDRQKFNARRYQVAFSEANPVIPSDAYVPVPVTPYLRGRPTFPDPNESGWKDTYRMNPGEVTRVLVRFAPQDGSPGFAFDAAAAPGYVWHCHILEHEENDMMRRFELVAPAPGLIASNAHAAREPDPEEVRLFAPSPNPVTASAELGFCLPVAGHVELDVYAVSGRHMRGVASGWFEAGEHSVSWPRVDDSGRPVRGGLYFVRLRGEGFSRTQKLIVAP